MRIATPYGAKMSRSSKFPCKPTSVTLPVDLYADARDLGIDISQLFERSLREVVNFAKHEKWVADNAEFIAEYNKRIEAEGTMLQEWNSF
ncbi:MAG: type II toxin-antitoxin system CcdA family antitoxin [Pseudomonadota bacterium]|nr:type II toxin-antitoxin system CcdA family antitoxin [Pseudomonadota bacterium]